MGICWTGGRGSSAKCLNQFEAAAFSSSSRLRSVHTARGGGVRARSGGFINIQRRRAGRGCNARTLGRGKGTGEGEKAIGIYLIRHSTTLKPGVAWLHFR